MAGPRDMDAAVDRLDAALQAAGLTGLREPESLEALDRSVAHVAPFDLPAELRRFWERVDPRKLEVTTFPSLLDPASAIELNEVALEFGVPATPPRTFFVIAYSSHVHLSIELDSEWGRGGTIVGWAWDDETFSIAYRSLTDLVDALADVLFAGRLERGDGYVLLDYDAQEEARLARLAAAPPDPRYAETREITSDVRSWPSHWLEASGIDLRDRVPLGATHTIAELVAAASRAPVSGRIHGTVIRGIGIGHDQLVLVEDGTGTLDISWSTGTTPWAPVHTRRYEFAVRIDRPVQGPPDVDSGHAEIVRHALAGEIEAAGAAASAFFGRISEHAPAAVATDVRPLDD